MPTQRPKVLSAVARPQDRAFRELLRALGLLERVQQTYFAQFGISGSQWGVLRNLHRAEQEGREGLRLTDLSERLLVRPPSVTGVVDRLERSGLVRREGSPTDLRTKQVGLTDRGRALVERVLTVHGAQIDTVMGGLESDEVVELERLLLRMRQHLEEVLAQRHAANIG
jgi:DNA-binding MarR family transcriptional regulator